MGYSEIIQSYSTYAATKQRSKAFYQMNNSVILIIAYGLATILYVLFHFSFIHTNTLVESNNVVAYVVSFSLFFLIPTAGLIHVSLVKLNRDALLSRIRYSLVGGLLGPLLLIVLISRSNDAESAMGYTLIPIAFLAFFLISFVFVFVFYYFSDRTT
jgi:drug/metabolite transporter (DMT)-like permease